MKDRAARAALSDEIHYSMAQGDAGTGSTPSPTLGGPPTPSASGWMVRRLGRPGLIAAHGQSLAGGVKLHRPAGLPLLE